MHSCLAYYRSHLCLIIIGLNDGSEHFIETTQFSGEVTHVNSNNLICMKIRHNFLPKVKKSSKFSFNFITTMINMKTSVRLLASRWCCIVLPKVLLIFLLIGWYCYPLSFLCFSWWQSWQSSAQQFLCKSFFTYMQTRCILTYLGWVEEHFHFWWFSWHDNCAPSALFVTRTTFQG